MIKITLDEFKGQFEKIKMTRDGQIVVQCPAHSDEHPSLYIRETDKGIILMHCMAGCSIKEIVDAMGIKIQDLFPNTRTKNIK